MAIIILIVLGFLLVILTIWILLGIHHKRVIVKEFDSCNVLIAGKQGTGKDLLTQAVINARKKPYYANMGYGGKYTHKEINDFSVSPNTYQDFIDGKITKIHKVGKDSVDVYISDAGIHLPSQYDSILYKKYPSFPIYYALSRQLYNQHIHMNAQQYTRIWKAIREQSYYP